MECKCKEGEARTHGVVRKYITVAEYKRCSNCDRIEWLWMKDSFEIELMQQPWLWLSGDSVDEIKKAKQKIFSQNRRAEVHL